MKIEKLEDIIEEIADRKGVYEGQYTQEQIQEMKGHPEDCKCRLCFTIGLNDRIRNALKNEFMEWELVSETAMPRDGSYIFVYGYNVGINYVYWTNGEWRYCYTGDPIMDMEKISHWVKPIPPKI